MTTPEWVATLIATNGFTLALATYISNSLVKRSELGAKQANDIRDAMIEKLQADHSSLEKQLSILKSEVSNLKLSISEKSDELRQVKRTLLRLKSVVLSHGRRHKQLVKYIEAQELKIIGLENSFLEMAESLLNMESNNSENLRVLNSKLSGAKRSINVVMEAMDNIKHQVGLLKLEEDFDIVT